MLAFKNTLVLSLIFFSLQSEAANPIQNCAVFLKNLFASKPNVILQPPPPSRIYPHDVSELIEMGEFQRALWQSKTYAFRSEIENFLKKANVVEEHSGIGGKGGAKRVILEGVFSGRRVRATAILKNNGVNREIAAHELDQLLNLDLSPMIVSRECGTQKCSIQLYVGDAVSGKDLNHERWKGTEDLTTEMYDYLIANTDRHHENYLYTLDSHRLVAIDAGQTFGFSGFRNILSPKSLLGNYDQRARALIDQLRKLPDEQIMEKLKPFLDKTELEDLLIRKKKLLEYSEKLTPDT